MRTRTVVIASGARYRRLDIANLAQFEGTCVHYWATPIEARLCGGQEVALVGAGNSAGQAAVYLASHVRKVALLARGGSLDVTAVGEGAQAWLHLHAYLAQGGRHAFGSRYRQQ